MTARTPVHGLQVATVLHRFIEEQVLPGTGVASAAFWQGVDALVHDLAPKNAALLAERERLQAELDRWHRAHPGPIRKSAKYRAFLEKIGYLVLVPAKVRATTRNVDAGAGQDLLLDEAVQRRGDLEAVDSVAIGHGQAVVG